MYTDLVSINALDFSICSFLKVSPTTLDCEDCVCDFFVPGKGEAGLPHESSDGCLLRKQYTQESFFSNDGSLDTKPLKTFFF